MTVDTLMQWMEEITGRPRPRLRLPPPLMAAIAAVESPVLTAVAPDRPQRLPPGAVHPLQMRRRADCSKSRQELGYVPTSVKEAVREAHAWFQEVA